MSMEITPLGAAVVEALPSRTHANRIKRMFRKTGACPTSKIFPTPESVKAFYSRGRPAEHGET